MKKGDLLLCNDGITKVEIVDFDEYSVSVTYEGKIHKRSIRCIGKTLHCINHCWNCGDEISTLFCNRCSVCGWRVCRKCDSCQKGECAYSVSGFDENGIHRNGTRFSYAGYDVEGYDREGYNKDGYDRQGFNSLGFDEYGYNSSGFNCDGIDREGYDRDGYGQDGYDRNGYNREGYDRNGYDVLGYNKEGYNLFGFKSDGIHRNGTLFSDSGYDFEGYNAAGFNHKGYDRTGYDEKGFDSSGYDKEGYDKKGYNRDGINRKGYDKNGLDAHWRTLIGRKVIYMMPKGDGNSVKKRGKVIHCYFKDAVHYVDIQFENGETYRKVEFNYLRKKGVLILLNKTQVETPKTIRPVKKAETQDVSEDVRDIFNELQDDYERDGEYHTGFGGCYGEDDRESEYYNPTHPYDD